jgi:hypothetical protein
MGKGRSPERRGIYWMETKKKYHVALQLGGKLRHIGYFSDYAEAVAARDKARLEYGLPVSLSSLIMNDKALAVNFMAATTKEKRAKRGPEKPIERRVVRVEIPEHITEYEWENCLSA